MKQLLNKFSGRIFLFIFLIPFGLSLQSFNGYRIEKRHYRKGYYIQNCHAPKTKPVYHEVVVNEIVTQKKSVVPVADSPVSIDETPEINNNTGDRIQNDAPVSRAINNSNH
ncbi:hypothetical protein BH09BAC5_BH09BAC5_29610 [soil metagenome]